MPQTYWKNANYLDQLIRAQLLSRIEQLNHQLEYRGPVSFLHLKKIQNDINDFKSFLRFHGLPENK